MQCAEQTVDVFFLYTILVEWPEQNTCFSLGKLDINVAISLFCIFDFYDNCNFCNYDGMCVFVFGTAYSWVFYASS